MKFYDANINSQMIRFGMVGFFSNILLYLLYLLFTGMGVGHKTAMTLLFVAGALQTFVINKRWTFEYKGIIRTTLVKFLLAYFFSYSLNLAALYLFVDYLDYEHQIVQVMMIVILAVVLFILQRYWVFRDSDSSAN